MVSAVSSAAAPSTRSNGALDSDPKAIQERFMKLLVAQLKNQDPLAPMDNAQVTSQMAQLNTVSGIQNLNETMKGLADQFAAGQLAQGTSVLGKTVLINGDTLTLNDGKAFGRFDAPTNFENAILTISDENGNVIKEVSMGSVANGVQNIEWDGTDQDGDPVPSGNYKFSVTGINGEESVDLPTQTYALVNSLNNKGAEGFVLSTSDGQEVSLSDVIQVI